MDTAKNSLSYRELPSPAAFDSFVLNFWTFKVQSLGAKGYDHHVPPDGCVSLVVRYSSESNAPETLLVGPRTETFLVRVTTLDQYYGVRFWPEAAAAVFGDKLGQALDFVGPAFVLLPELARSLSNALPKQPSDAGVFKSLTEHFALSALIDTPVDHAVSVAIRRIVANKGVIRIGDVAEGVGLSLRQLQRRFRSASGLTPKQFARLRRFRNAAAELLKAEPRPWVDVAYDAGFADQAHLSREFSQLIGLTAEELRRKHGVIKHEDVEP